MNPLPTNLPDARTAQRLLDLLTQLEHALANPRASKAAHPQQNQRADELEAEVTRLKKNQKEARSRLATLIEKIESSIAPAEEEAA